MKKFLILYSYYEYNNSISNLEFFLKNAYIESNDYQFIITINGYNCSVEIPEKNNIKVIKRKNTGYDFGGWSESLKSVHFYNYDYFIFINSTCIGPFIPRYTPKNLTWCDLFVSKLDNDYKLCGPTINYLKNNKISDIKHIQSFAYGTDTIGLNLLLRNGIFDVNDDIQRKELIINHEIGISKVILNNNYKLFAFQLSENKNSKMDEKHHDDIHYNDKYYNDTINPMEVMFVKINRINTPTLINYINWSE